MVRSLKHLLALLLYSVLTLIMTWPAVSRLKVAVLGDHIDSYLNTWIIAWGIHKITAGELRSLFDANIFFPYPNTLAYSEHLLGIALLGSADPTGIWPARGDLQRPGAGQLCPDRHGHVFPGLALDPRTVWPLLSRGCFLLFSPGASATFLTCNCYPPNGCR